MKRSVVALTAASLLRGSNASSNPPLSPSYVPYGIPDGTIYNDHGGYYKRPFRFGLGWMSSLFEEVKRAADQSFLPSQRPSHIPQPPYIPPQPPQPFRSQPSHLYYAPPHQPSSTPQQQPYSAPEQQPYIHRSQPPYIPQYSNSQRFTGAHEQPFSRPLHPPLNPPSPSAAQSTPAANPVENPTELNEGVDADVATLVEVM